MAERPFSVVFAEDDTMFRLMEMAIRREPTPAGVRTLDYFFGPDAGTARTQLLDAADAAGLSASAQPTVCTGPAELAAALVAADMVVVESQPIGATELRRAGPQLAVVQKFGTITDTIDVAAAAAREIRVHTMVRTTTISCAEHVLGLILALSRRLLAAHAAVVSSTGDQDRPAASTGDISTKFNWAGVDGVRLLHGRTLGLLGFGEIARAVAVRAMAFGMDVVYHKRHPVPAAGLPEALRGVRPVDFEELLAESDIVSVHVPSNPETAHLIDARALGRMRPSAWLVNMARGAIVDEVALESALRERRIAGAALDVYREEPVPLDSGLLQVDNVVWSPHLAAGSAWFVLDEVRSMLATIAQVERGTVSRAERH